MHGEKKNIAYFQFACQERSYDSRLFSCHCFIGCDSLISSQVPDMELPCLLPFDKEQIVARPNHNAGSANQRYVAFYWGVLVHCLDMMC